MRYRLSSKFSTWQKILLTILLSLLLFFGIGVSSGILRNLPDLGWGNYVVLIAFVLLCFKLVDWFLGERIVVEFDNDNLYISDNKTKQEEIIPLKNLIKLNLRPTYASIGNYWMYRYTLTLLDNFNREQRISFSTKPGNRNTKKFALLVKSKNSDFQYKDWADPLDFFD